MAKTFHFTGAHIDHDGSVELGTYSDGSIAIRLRSLYGDLLLIPTVNLQHYDEKPELGHVFIKDYGDTEGVYESLRANGIVGEKIRTVNYGGFDAKAYECELTLPRSEAHLL